MNKIQTAFIAIVMPFFIIGSIMAQDAAATASAGLADYWPHIMAMLLVISEILALSPLKAHGIVDAIIKIIKAVAGKK